MNTSFVSRSHQRGASLLVSLIFLVVMAMLGVTLANVTNLEERMSGNTRDRDLALQAAEASLRDAEVQLGTAAFRAIVFPNYVLDRGNDAAFWETCFTSDPRPAPCGTLYEPKTALPTTGTGAIAAPPQFIVESKGLVGATQVYRVTARAVGGSPDTIVVLQAEFGYTP